MEFIQTQRGKRKLLRNSYMYVYQKDLADMVTSWECVQRRGSKKYPGTCNARLKLDAGDNFIESVNQHNHPPSHTQCEVSKIKAAIKRRAETTNETSQQVLAAELAGVSAAAAANLPALHHMRRTIRSQKQANANLPPLPASIADIPVLPAEYQTTISGQQFQLYDSGVGDATRIFIFGSPEGMTLLQQSGNWFCDGTFKVVPELFYQLYTVHALTGTDVFPCIYALLPIKTQVTYSRLFRELHGVTNAASPTTVLMDFEKAALNVFEGVHPNTEVVGCFFHLSKNIWRKIQQNGLQQRYQDDDDFLLHARMIMALTFVPPVDIDNAFDDLFNEIRANFNNDLDVIMNYFEDTYIGRVRRNGRRDTPMFPVEMWNMYNRTRNHLPRTNNNVEGWHNGLQANINACHPNLWKFFDVLKQEENLSRVKLTQCLAGIPQPESTKT